ASDEVRYLLKPLRFSKLPAVDTVGVGDSIGVCRALLVFLDDLDANRNAAPAIDVPAQFVIPGLWPPISGDKKEWLALFVRRCPRWEVGRRDTGVWGFKASGVRTLSDV